MKKRPLLGVLLLFILVIFIWYQTGNKDPVSCSAENVSVTGVVKEIQNTASGSRLILSDVLITGCRNTAENKNENTDKISCSKILVYDKKNASLFSDLKLGNSITLKGTVCSFSLPGNPGQFNEFEYYRQQNINYKMFPERMLYKNHHVDRYRQYLYECREQLCNTVRQCMPAKEAGIINAVLFGDKSELPEDIKLLYQRNGIAHLLAISGLHVTILAGSIFWLLRKYIMKMQSAALVTIIFLITYGELTGFSIATSRAVVMMICLLCAKILGKSYDMLSAMALSAIIILLQKPYALMNNGFLLSYGTVLGIYLLTPVLTDIFQINVVEERYGKKIAELLKSLSASMGATLMTLPAIMYTYYEIPSYSVLLNLVILPFLSFVVGLGMASAVVGCFFHWIGKFLLGTVHFILQYYELVCCTVSNFPAAVLITGQPGRYQIGIYYLIIIIWVYRYSGNASFLRKIPSMLLLLILLLVLFIPKANREFELTMLDVGQGDGIFLQSGKFTMLMDGGSSSEKQVGKYRIIPYLKYRGISHVDIVAISHPDSDHTSGLLELLENEDSYGISVGKVLLPERPEPDEEYLLLEKKIRKAGMEILKVKAGDYFSCGDMKFCCYYPYGDTVAESANDYSMVLRAECGKFSALLTGDLGEEGEKKMIEGLGSLPQTDILKVGHHGSKTSTSEELLNHLKPRIALISAGKENRYGHPSREVTERLKTKGISTYVTIRSGAVSVYGVGDKLWVEKYRR